MSADVGAEDNEEWLRQYLHDYITLEEAGAVAGGISREAIRLRLKKLGMTPRTSAETLRLRELREISAHATTIRETFYATRSESQVSAATGLSASAIRRFLDREIPDWTIVASVARDVRKRYSETEMLDSLRDASQGRTVPLTVTAYRGFVQSEPALADGRPRPGVQGMMLRFGSWNAAVRAAGLPANPHSGPAREFDALGAVAAVADCWRELGSPPSVRAYDVWQAGRPGSPSSATIRKLLSSWPSVQIRAWQIVHGVLLDQDDQDIAIPKSETGPILESSVFLPEYKRANQGAVVSLPESYEVGEYNALERAVRSHARIQNRAASVGAEIGLNVHSPGAEGPAFDLAFSSQDGTLFVIEVKSATPENLELQARLGLGQVLIYAHALRRIHKRVVPILLTELPLNDDWAELMQSLEVGVASESSMATDLARMADSRQPSS
ncbi:hypothetical protein [Microbacterium hydrocarbonoxydans]|uniref:hypothetical protein n=1 Tax=Microbacterium hydrocarbonoxydans TaxID=273678 RepID=UPI002040C98F|nr:hypothetical protein [Microbacterium hydrocarbonoxydans]MCM3778813.1 hypothetical protein [Microbacterium hydrocarbonoxydans]